MTRTLLIGLAMAALTLSPGLAAPESASSRATAISRLNKRFTIEIKSRSFKDALASIESTTGVTLQPLWATATNEGLDPSFEISLTAKSQPLTQIFESLLEQADPDSTWQLSRSGAIQIGPKSRLNAFKRIHTYDVSDLLRIVPNHRRGPNIDLQQALQASGNSGSSSPISGADEGNDWLEELPITRERAEELATLIRDMIETDQWTDNGGEAATMRIVGASLVVNAPDYIHRAIGGLH